MKTSGISAGGDRMGYLKAELSTSNKYWIPKHRYYELRHYCLQYSEWKRVYTLASSNNYISAGVIHQIPKKIPGDKIGKQAIILADLSRNIELVERVCKEVAPDIYKWLLISVTEGVTYVQLKTLYDIPCGKEMFYDRYRKFFWRLSAERP